MTPSRRQSARFTKSETSTAGRLVYAAMEEFRDGGYAGTDSNRIARRAGFAPQTFYRWFPDKTAVFLAAYRQWEEEERRALDTLVVAGRPLPKLIEAVVAHHRDYLRFRRSLRQLAVEDTTVRRARAESRLRQIERIRERLGLAESRRGVIAVAMLQIERLADALAEGEFKDLGMDESTARQAMLERMRQLIE